MKWLLLLGLIMCPISTAGSVAVDVSLSILWFFDRQFKNKILFLKSQVFCHAILAFLLIHGLSLFYTSAPATDIHGSLRDLSRYLLILIVASEYRVHRFLIKKTPYLIYGLFIFTTAGVTAFTLLNKGGGFLNTNRIFLSYFSSLSLFFLLHGAYQLSINNQPKKWMALLMIALVGSYFLLYNFEYNPSRSGTFLFPILTLIFIWQRFSGWHWYLMSLGALVLGCILFTHSNLATEKLLEAKQQVIDYCCQSESKMDLNHLTSLGERLSFYKTSLDLIKKKPWLGYGIGSFKQEYSAYATKISAAPSKNPHNEYLNVAFQTGLLGLCCLLIVGFALFHGGVISPADQLHQFFMAGVVLSLSIGCFLNSWLMDFKSMHLLIFLGGYALVARMDENRAH